MDIKKSLFHPILIFTVAFLAGGLTMWVWDRATEKPRYVYQSRGFDHPFMQDLMGDDFFSRTHDIFQSTFDFGGEGFGDVHQREDQDFVYFDIDLKGQTPKNFNVEVRDGQITIQGELESESAEGHFSSRFERSFPTPDGVDASGFRLDPTDGKMTLILPKAG